MVKIRKPVFSPIMLPILVGFGLAFVWLWLFFACLAPWARLVHEQNDVANAKQMKAGQVCILGNRHTSDWLIRSCLRIYPGSAITKADLQRAEHSLNMLGLFKCDPENGIGPAVRFVDGEGAFRDIVVQVEELPGNELHFAALEWRIAVVLEDIEGMRLSLERIRMELQRVP